MPARVLIEFAIEDAGYWNQLDVYSITILPEGIVFERELETTGAQVVGPCVISDPLFREEEDLKAIFAELEQCIRKHFGNVVIEYKDWTGYGDA